jgi:hypothetical protein
LFNGWSRSPGPLFGFSGLFCFFSWLLSGHSLFNLPCGGFWGKRLRSFYRRFSFFLWGFCGSCFLDRFFRLGRHRLLEPVEISFCHPMPQKTLIIFFYFIPRIFKIAGLFDLCCVELKGTKFIVGHSFGCHFYLW